MAQGFITIAIRSFGPKREFCSAKSERCPFLTDRTLWRLSPAKTFGTRAIVLWCRLFGEEVGEQRQTPRRCDGCRDAEELNNSSRKVTK